MDSEAKERSNYVNFITDRPEGIPYGPLIHFLPLAITVTFLFKH